MQVKATCGICQGNCKVVLTVEDGKIIKVEPDRESPRGRACFRGVHAPGYPVRRTEAEKAAYPCRRKRRRKIP